MADKVIEKEKPTSAQQTDDKADKGKSESVKVQRPGEPVENAVARESVRLPVAKHTVAELPAEKKHPGEAPVDPNAGLSAKLPTKLPKDREPGEDKEGVEAKQTFTKKAEIGKEMKRTGYLSRDAIAYLVSETLRMFNELMGEEVPDAWDSMQQADRDVLYSEIHFSLQNTNASAAETHDVFYREKHAAGWTYGSKFDEEAKSDPQVLEYRSLPRHMQLRSELIRGIVKALSSAYRVDTP